ncbi:aspartyl/asparaginyl beta-hydroxylase domain-containing protein [Nitrospirillum bahiense]|uniref:Tetratricopeptide repeat protein n=1 Tax=Nitrospirillum amazonense TaxID=28077 RepID=A0A560FUG1_9PROT|nr:aspartyl/asparaginyl beta-hydroxylase domain-containing protein [Nitrospirillum amazonense]TWB25278.1 tetratricopeptide repeat protein [Nitrospirillum amazonense]
MQPDVPAQRSNAAAMAAMKSGNYADAHAILEEALRQSPGELPLWLNLAAARRAMGRHADALAAVDQVLTVEPRLFMALLMRASLLQALGRKREAGEAYGVAVALGETQQNLDPPTQRALDQARKAHAAHVQEMADFLRPVVDQGAARGTSADARRMAFFTDQVLGRRKVYTQQPTHYHYPDMPAIEFYDREECPWLPTLEAATADIQAELAAILAEEALAGAFVPYIDYRDGLPLDQWAELNRSPRWSAFHLLQHGLPVPGNADRAPKTMAVLEQMPQPRMIRRSPAAMFSILKPRTRIPPHTGVANTRLVVHLPLVVPPGCGFRVGNQTREWKVGVGWAFDDTIEHEAWNDSDQVRVVMIFDIWSPRLSAAERDFIAHIIAAMDDFQAQQTEAAGGFGATPLTPKAAGGGFSSL